MNDIFEKIKVIIDNYINSKRLADFCYGTVTSTSPLTVKVDSKLTLYSPQLILTRAVLDHELDITDGVPEWTFPPPPWRYKIHNALEVGDVVYMLRAMGGQKYVIFDKEWVKDDTIKQQ